MSELEPETTVDELADWLMDNGYAEDRRGYGHVTGDELAEALLAKYRITVKEYTS